MSSRYDEIERLQRLRESGALTDSEFQAEKTRILGHGDSIPEPMPAPAAEEGVPVAGEPPSRLPLYLLIGAGILIVAVVAGLLLGRFVSGPAGTSQSNVALPQENLSSDSNLIPPEAPPDVRSLAPAEQLARAFEAAFGARGSATLTVESRQDNETDSFAEQVRYTPGKLVSAPFGPVLLSEGQVTDAAHVSAGKIAIHYLKPAGDGFAVVKAWPSGVVTGSFGKVARWSVSHLFSDWPVIVSEGGGTWQGYTCSWAKLTELRPTGPVELATVPLSYSDEGARTDEGEARTISGKIINVVQNQSFDVIYSGSRSFSEHWVREGAGYRIAGGAKSQMESC